MKHVVFTAEVFGSYLSCYFGLTVAHLNLCAAHKSPKNHPRFVE